MGESGREGYTVGGESGFDRYLGRVIDTIPDALVVFTLDGHPVHWNAPFNEMVGYTDAEIPSMEAPEFFPAQDAVHVMEVFEEVLSTGEDRFIEARVRHKSGGLTSCSLSGSVLMGDDGEVIGLLGIGRDITPIKEAQKELYEERSFVETILENIPEAVIVYGSSGAPLRWNRAFRELVGYSDGEIAGLRVADFHPEHLRDGVMEAFTYQVEEGESFELESSIQSKGGREIICNLLSAPLKDASGEVVGLVGVGLDITDRRRQERELLEEREFVDTILESMADAFIVYDMEGNPLRWNNAYRELVGYRDEEIARRKAWDFHPAGDVEYVAAEFAEVVNTGVTRFIDTGVLHKSGERIPCILSGAVIRDAEGKPVGLVGIGRDISEKKQQEKELERHRERLEELVRLRTRELEEANLQLRMRMAEVEKAREELVRLNRELEGYAHAVSHELRNPLSGIYLAVEWLERLPAEGNCVSLREEVARLSEQVKANVSRAETHIKGLLALAEAGQRPVNVVPVDINGTVESILREITPLLDARGVKVEVEGDLGTLSANPTQMYQLFGNLIDNAVKHNDADGLRVTIRRLEESDGAKRYAVEDNGAGVDPEVIGRLSKPFATSGDGRTGLGLAIVGKIVSVYRGEIRAYNEGGACFEFTLRDVPDAEHGG